MGLFNPLSKGLLSDEGCGLGLPSEVQYTNLHCLNSFKQRCHRNQGPCDGEGLCGRQGGAYRKSLSSSVLVKMDLQGGETFLQPTQAKVGLFAFKCRIQAACHVLPGCQTPIRNPFFLILHHPVHAHCTAVPGRLSESHPAPLPGELQAPAQRTFLSYAQQGLYRMMPWKLI